MRLTLRPWQACDRDIFAALHGDPEVTADLNETLTRRQSDAKFDRYRASYTDFGFCRWAVERNSGGFIGYAGLMRSADDHPLGAHVNIAWRLAREAWGAGYATEAASAALQDGFTRLRLNEVLAYTDANNMKSQAVMRRLGLHPEPELDFKIARNGVSWRGLVWSARPEGGRRARI
ncbi:MAG: GNAT family N-acetyltransferase [Pseudomonadota bacterium]